MLDKTLKSEPSVAKASNIWKILVFIKVVGRSKLSNFPAMHCVSL